MSSAAANAGSSGLPSSYRDYEKKTYDAWDIDDGDDEDGLSAAGNGRMFDYYHNTAASAAHHLPISLADSDAVAKQIIRSHQEKQKSSASSSPSTPTTTTSSPSAVQSTSIISPKGPGNLFFMIFTLSNHIIRLATIK